jgi:hypothetical protein
LRGVPWRCRLGNGRTKNIQRRTGDAGQHPHFHGSNSLSFQALVSPPEAHNAPHASGFKFSLTDLKMCPAPERFRSSAESLRCNMEVQGPRLARRGPRQITRRYKPGCRRR